MVDSRRCFPKRWAPALLPKEDNGASGHTVVGILFNYMNKLRDQIIYGSWPATVLSAHGVVHGVLGDCSLHCSWREEKGSFPFGRWGHRGKQAEPCGERNGGIVLGRKNMIEDDKISLCLFINWVECVTRIFLGWAACGRGTSKEVVGLETLNWL
jgi:hypothetical protein